MPSFPRHPALEGYLGFLLRKVSAASFERFSEQAGKHGLHPMHFGLLTVLEADGPISQQALADRIGVDPSTMVARMDRVVELKLVDRERSAEDRRSYEISLNAKGRKTLEALRAEARASGEEIFGPLTSGEREQLRALLTKLADHIDEDDPAKA